jgi:flagellar basal body rod protein FlgG
MSIDAEMLRLIADNIANSETPGYQRKIGVQRAEFSLDAAQVESGLQQGASSASADSSLPAVMDVALDSAPGTLIQTREPLDVALNGGGSLIVSTPKGEIATRGAKLQVNSQGMLVTQSGDPILGVAGPISFSGAVINYNDIDITPEGAVKLSGNIVGQLRIDPAPDSSDTNQPVAPRVMQGFLEKSNVDSVTEMLKLMEVFRHFESSQKALRNYDALLQQAISDLGKI